jgi:Protein of unknown function (DUF1353)
VPFVPEALQLNESGPDTPDDWSMTTPLSWTGTFRGQIGRLLVPASVSEPFVTDLASVPRSLTWLIPRYGMYTKAAVLHDYLCQTVGTETIAVYPTPDTAPAADAGPQEPALITLGDRSDADEIFRLAMTDLGVPWARRWLMWSAVSWATLWTSLWPGRSSKPALRWVGRALLVAAVVALGLVVWLGVVWFVSDAAWRWLRVGVLVVVAATVAAAGVLAAGYVAQGRWDRWLVYLAALGVTMASLPLLAVAAVIAVLIVGYLLFEDAFSGFEATRARLGRMFGLGPAAPRTARTARIEAVRAS